MLALALALSCVGIVFLARLLLTFPEFIVVFFETVGPSMIEPITCVRVIFSEFRKRFWLTGGW